jgi:hypothetical protein
LTVLATLFFKKLNRIYNQNVTYVTTLDKLVTEGETAKLTLHLLWWLPLVLDWDGLHLVGTARHSHVQILA